MGQLHRHVDPGNSMPCGGLGSPAWLLALASALTNLQEPARRGPVHDPRRDFLRACPRHAHARAVAREGFGSKPRPTEASRQREGSTVLGGWGSHQRSCFDNGGVNCCIACFCV